MKAQLGINTLSLRLPSCSAEAVFLACEATGRVLLSWRIPATGATVWALGYITQPDDFYLDVAFTLIQSGAPVDPSAGELPASINAVYLLTAWAHDTLTDDPPEGTQNAQVLAHVD